MTRNGVDASKRRREVDVPSRHAPPSPSDTRRISYGGHDMLIAGLPGDAYFEHVGDHVHHCRFFVAVLAHCLQSGATIVDIGANIGLTSALAAAFVENARVFAVEPSPKIYECLLRTARLNGLQNFTALNACIGQADGQMNLVEGQDSSASYMSARPTGVPIPMRSLDSIAREYDLDTIDLVKIDVEGLESTVLDGMTETNARFAPFVLMEFNSFTLTAYGNISPRALLDRICVEYGGFVVGGEQPRFYSSEKDRVTFLSDNMLRRGCVDDILFSAARHKMQPLIQVAQA